MHRFFVPPEACHGPALTLPEPEARHAFRVLRVRERERVVVLDGAGGEFLCEVEEADRRAVRLRILHKDAIPPLPYEVTLLQAVPKGGAMELIVQKATELGAHRIVPLMAERTVAQLDDSAAAHKVDKWRVISIEAAKQCGAAWLPGIDIPIAPQSFVIQSERFDLSLVASLQREARHPGEYFRAFVSDKKRRPKTVGVWVGPEGDFTPAELKTIRAAGALPITLGPLVLRSETAAIYCLSVIHYELQSAGD